MGLGSLWRWRDKVGQLGGGIGGETVGWYGGLELQWWRGKGRGKRVVLWGLTGR